MRDKPLKCIYLACQSTEDIEIYRFPTVAKNGLPITNVAALCPECYANLKTIYQTAEAIEFYGGDHGLRFIQAIVPPETDVQLLDAYQKIKEGGIL